MIAVALGAAAVSAAAPQGDDHLNAVAALDSVRAAVAEIDRAERVGAEGPDAYRNGAQRAINALVGSKDPRYRGEAGPMSRAQGALERLNGLADRSGSSPWAEPVSAARVHVIAAVAQLEEALQSDDLDKFEIHASEALELLEMAVGRSTELGPFGGLSGALATTGLGVPVHARVTNGCSAPRVAPAHGMIDGYMLYVAIPLQQGSTTLPEPLGTTVVSRQGDILILHTAAQKLEQRLCHRAENTGTEPSHGQLAGAAKTDPPPRSAGAQHAGGDPPGPPALYTQEQARAGKKVYDTRCVLCHGQNMQGTSAPSVAGDDFLTAASHNGWSVDDLRSIVEYSMPFNAPGTLSSKQTAEVIAYLLASNCYPAGDKPFPEKDAPALGDVKLQAKAGLHPSDDQLGTCKVP